ncbi:MAG: hypothetical protein GX879_01250 [Bacteroidales bacterium]|nr:hypothetical protein [Bacteroidales bacterium]
MRKIFIFTLLLLLVFSCSHSERDLKNKELENKLIELQKENESLLQRDLDKDVAIQNFVENLEEISANLELIKQKEDIISIVASDVEFHRMDIEKISEDVLLINDLLDKNRKIIENLDKDLSASLIYSNKLQKVINNLKLIIERQESEIHILHSELQDIHSHFNELKLVLDSVNIANKAQQKKIENFETYKNTAYYLIGSVADLLALDVILASGGVLGLGKTYVLNEDFDKSVFTEINISNFKKIPLNCKSAEIISNHPSTSYKFDGPRNFTNNLVITRPKEFWSNNKYLVILTK